MYSTHRFPDLTVGEHAGPSDRGTLPPMPHPNDELIERFYAAFARRDGDGMAECYAPSARFSDPVFVDLTGEEPGAMWRMLTGRSKDLVVTLRDHEADEAEGRAR